MKKIITVTICTAIAATALATPANAMIIASDVDEQNRTICYALPENMSDEASYINFMQMYDDPDAIIDFTYEYLGLHFTIPDSQFAIPSIKNAYLEFIDALTDTMAKRNNKPYLAHEIENGSYLADSWVTAAQEFTTVASAEVYKNYDLAMKDKWIRSIDINGVASDFSLETINSSLEDSAKKLYEAHTYKMSTEHEFIKEAIKHFDIQDNTPLGACLKLINEKAPAGTTINLPTPKLSLSAAFDSLADFYKKNYNHLISIYYYQKTGREFSGYNVDFTIPQAIKNHLETVAAQDLLEAQAFYVLYKQEYPQATATIATDKITNNPFATTNIAITKNSQPIDLKNVKEGDRITLTSTHDTTGKKLQWYKDGEAIQGATNKTLTITIDNNIHSYRCIATDNSGATSLSSTIIPAKQKEESPRQTQTPSPNSEGQQPAKETGSSKGRLGMVLILGLLAVIGIGVAASMTMTAK